MDALDEEELETILVIARNGQSGRITEYEIKRLVNGYRQHLEATKTERERCAKIVHNHQIAFASDACGWALDKIKDGLPADAAR